MWKKGANGSASTSPRNVFPPALRFGSGDADITSISLFDKSGRTIDYCSYGGEVKVVYKVLFKENVEGPIFGIRITDYRGNIIYGTNSRLNNIRTGAFKKGDEATVAFSFKVTLIGGEYSVSPAVGYNDNKTYCDWINNMFSINVIHRNIAEGIADLNPEMIVEKK